MDSIEILDECGFKKPITRLKLEDKDELIQAVALDRVLLKSLGEATQFRDGLSALSVQESMKKNPDLFMPYYCLTESDVLNSGMCIASHICHTYCCNQFVHIFFADKLRNLFTDIKYSEKGSSIRIREETAFMYFVDYLDDCEGGKVSLTTNMYFNAICSWFLSVNALTEEMMHQVDVDDHDGNYGKYMSPY